MKKILLFVILALTTLTIKAQVPSYVATNGLIGYWPFNGNANDESGNGKNGVKFQVAGTTDRFGNLNSAYSFDGISSYIEVTNSAGFDLGGNDFTISLWVNIQADILRYSVNLISKSLSALGVGINENGSWGLPNTNVKYGVGFDTYGKGYGMYPDILPKSGWNHIVCVKTNSGYDYYINSQKYTLDFNQNNISKSDINNSLFFGKTINYDGFKGILDDIAIYNRALTQQEITNLEQADAFITTWATTTGFETITLSAQPDASNYNINWGDGYTNSYTATQAPSHTYINSGEHTISFTGTFPHLTFQNQSKLKAVQQWGTQKWTSMANMFQSCTNLNSFPSQLPDLTLCTNMSYMFSGATAFNQPIGSWNVGNVTNMSNMFGGNDGGIAFNQPIGLWNVSRVTNMSYMFSFARSFNQPIENWNVSQVTDMGFMFFDATAFNQTIGSWNVSKVTDMSGMFMNASSFNQPINSWDVISIKKMSQMFQMASSFNKPLGSWNVSQVTDMSNMFAQSSSFNQPLGSWNVSNVINMSWMFGSQLNDTPFNQDIGSWNVSNVTSMSGMFYGAKLSTANYDATLIGWATRAANGGVKQGVGFDGGSSNYCNGLGARNYLINTYKWVITDGSLNCTGLGTEEFDKSSLNLYPNPTSSVLNIKADDIIANQPYTITDVLGKIVLKGKLNEGDTTISVEHLSKGIYYIKIANNKASKFIKE